jgi:hypothetical protein
MTSADMRTAAWKVANGAYYNDPGDGSVMYERVPYGPNNYCMKIVRTDSVNYGATFVALYETSGGGSKSKVTFVAFRGTDETKDWLVNLNSAPVDCTLRRNNCGKVHGGFYNTYTGSEGYLQRVVEGWVQAKAANQPVVFTGHSLGSALAVLATMDMAYANYYSPLKSLHYVGFATPSLFNLAAQTAWNRLVLYGRIDSSRQYETNTPSFKRDLIPAASEQLFGYIGLSVSPRILLLTQSEVDASGGYGCTYWAWYPLLFIPGDLDKDCSERLVAHSPSSYAAAMERLNPIANRACVEPPRKVTTLRQALSKYYIYSNTPRPKSIKYYLSPWTKNKVIRWIEYPGAAPVTGITDSIGSVVFYTTKTGLIKNPEELVTATVYFDGDDEYLPSTATGKIIYVQKPVVKVTRVTAKRGTYVTLRATMELVSGNQRWKLPNQKLTLTVSPLGIKKSGKTDANGQFSVRVYIKPSVYPQRYWTYARFAGNDYYYSTYGTQSLTVKK